MDALRSPPNRRSSSATACARCLAALAAEADVTEVLAAGGLPFVGTVDLVDEGRLENPLVEFITLCLTEEADPWVGDLVVPSAALDRGRRSGVGLDAAAGVVEVALRRESLFSCSYPGQTLVSNGTSGTCSTDTRRWLFTGRRGRINLPWNILRRRLGDLD